MILELKFASLKVCVPQLVLNSCEEELDMLLRSQEASPHNRECKLNKRVSKNGLVWNKEWKTVVKQEEELERQLGLHGL